MLGSASGFQWKSHLILDVWCLLIAFLIVSVVLKDSYKHICHVTFQKADKHIKYENRDFMIKMMKTNEFIPKNPHMWKACPLFFNFPVTFHCTTNWFILVSKKQVRRTDLKVEEPWRTEKYLRPPCLAGWLTRKIF